MEKFADSLGTQLNITARRMRLALEKELAPVGLTPSQWMTLMALGEKDHQGQTELARMVNLDSATTTRCLDRLQEMSLLIRNQDQDDRRAQIVSLTDKGRQAYREWNDIGQEVNKRATKAISRPEAKKVLELLAMIGSNLENASMEI